MYMRPFEVSFPLYIFYKRQNQDVAVQHIHINYITCISALKIYIKIWILLQMSHYCSCEYSARVYLCVCIYSLHHHTSNCFCQIMLYSYIPFSAKIHSVNLK
jgi:hypothetical protein